MEKEDARLYPRGIAARPIVSGYVLIRAFLGKKFLEGRSNTSKGYDEKYDNHA